MRAGVPARIALALSSAVLFSCSLPPVGLGALAWFSLTPLLLACRSGCGWTGAAALGLVHGVAVGIGTYSWIFEIDGFRIHHFLLLAGFFSLYPAVWCASLSRLGRHPAAMLLGPPSSWVCLDYLKAHAGFMAFPWGTLAHTQHENRAVLQLATITGEYGITFLVVLSSSAAALVIARRAWRPATVAACLVGAAHAGGALALHAAGPDRTVRLAVVQPSIQAAERETPQGRKAISARLEGLSRVAASSRPDLIIWPETALLGSPRADPRLSAYLRELARDIDTPIVLGVGEVEKMAGRDVRVRLERRAYNSAYLVRPAGPLDEPYRKRVLLPFGEYIPLEGLVELPGWLTPPIFSTAAGSTARVFEVDEELAFAALICWENLFEHLARESVRAGAGWLVVMTNDSWFGRSAQPHQHNLASVLRAVENRVPVAISSNTGPSALIDPYGRVVARTEQLFTEATVTADIALHGGGTFYTRFGNVFVLFVLAGLSIGTLFALAGPHFPRRPSKHA